MEPGGGEGGEGAAVAILEGGGFLGGAEAELGEGFVGAEEGLAGGGGAVGGEVEEAAQIVGAGADAGAAFVNVGGRHVQPGVGAAAPGGAVRQAPRW